MRDGRRLGRWIQAAALLSSVALGCEREGEPTEASYTLKFPSTEAAVATDAVQILVFDAPADPAERAQACADKIARRLRRDALEPAQASQPQSVCEMFTSARPFTVPFGDKVVFAIAQRRGQDFLLGCSLQTIGDGDAPVPIALALADISNAVPPTTCTSLGEFCQNRCPAP